MRRLITPLPLHYFLPFRHFTAELAPRRISLRYAKIRADITITLTLIFLRYFSFDFHMIHIFD